MDFDDIDGLVSDADSIGKEIDNDPLLTYKHLPGEGGIVPGPQEQFHDCPAKIKALCGGNRSGKSTEGAEYMLSKALATPGGRGWCACPSNELSVQVQQRKIWELLPKKEIHYGHYDSVNGFRHATLVLKNNYTLMFKSYEQGVEKFQSDNIDQIWLDEEPPYNIYQECLMRTLDSGGEVFMTLTPLSGYTRFVDEVLIKRKARDDTDMNGVRVFSMNTLDNVTLDKQQVSKIVDDIDEEMKPARLRGIPVNLQGLVYKDWRDQYPFVVPVEKWVEVRDQTTRYVSIDPHNRTPTAVGFYGIDREGRFWLYDELFKSLLIPDLAKEIKKREAGVEVKWRVIDNSSQGRSITDGMSIRMQLFQHGITTLLATKDDKNQGSIALMRNMLKPGLKGELPMFVVVENCTRARYEFQRYSWADYGTEKKRDSADPKPEVRKKDDHIMDANHYIIRSYASYDGADRRGDIEKEKSESAKVVDYSAYAAHKQMQETRIPKDWRKMYAA